MAMHCHATQKQKLQRKKQFSKSWPQVQLHRIGVTAVHSGQSSLAVSEEETLGNLMLGAQVPIEVLQTHPLKQKNPKQTKQKIYQKNPNQAKLPEKQIPTCDCRKTCIPRK